jgi:hypothetical protein
VASQLSSSLGEALLSYTGPEPERVRTAVAALAKDDLDRARHLLAQANEDYRDVLWWAELDAKEQAQLAALGGMTVNERLFHLGLMAEFATTTARWRQTGDAYDCQTHFTPRVASSRDCWAA